MRYRVIKDSDEITVILEDGGVACIRYADEMEEGDGRTAVTDYYQSRFDQTMIDEENIWEELGEGKMYCKDWYGAKFDSKEVINDALTWLCVECTFTEDETIWEGF